MPLNKTKEEREREGGIIVQVYLGVGGGGRLLADCHFFLLSTFWLCDH